MDQPPSHSDVGKKAVIPISLKTLAPYLTQTTAQDCSQGDLIHTLEPTDWNTHRALEDFKGICFSFSALVILLGEDHKFFKTIEDARWLRHLAVTINRLNPLSPEYLRCSTSGHLRLTEHQAYAIAQLNRYANLFKVMSFQERLDCALNHRLPQQKAFCLLELDKNNQQWNDFFSKVTDDWLELVEWDPMLNVVHGIASHHTTLIRKNKDKLNAYDFFDPNHGLFKGLSHQEILDKLKDPHRFGPNTPTLSYVTLVDIKSVLQRHWNFEGFKNFFEGSTHDPSKMLRRHSALREAVSDHPITAACALGSGIPIYFLSGIKNHALTVWMRVAIASVAAILLLVVATQVPRWCYGSAPRPIPPERTFS